LILASASYAQGCYGYAPLFPRLAARRAAIYNNTLGGCTGLVATGGCTGGFAVTTYVPQTTYYAPVVTQGCTGGTVNFNINASVPQYTPAAAPKTYNFNYYINTPPINEVNLNLLPSNAYRKEN
jgi:hypothetical protein